MTQTPAQAHAAAVRRHIAALPRWGWGDRQGAVAAIVAVGEALAEARVLAGLEGSREAAITDNRTIENLVKQRDAAEKQVENLRQQFPPCPGCGCRWPEEPDQRECGCDMGCNDGPHAPGINVLLAELAAELKASRADADLVRDEKSEGDRALMAVVAERDRLRAAIQRVLADKESGEGGWGPDVTMVTVLREALEPQPAPTPGGTQ